MSRLLSRISLVLVILLSSEVWALGLGDIRLLSALNEPLRAEIELISATPGELDNLQIELASADTFERYGLDRPLYLQNIRFEIIRTGRTDGNLVKLRTATPMAEPFLTFLVEANWSRGRLLREYTVLLDPPTFVPRALETVPTVQAPSRSAPVDSGRIERSEPAPTRQIVLPDPDPEPVTAVFAAPDYPEPVESEAEYSEVEYSEVEYSEPDYVEPEDSEPEYSEPDYSEPEYSEPEPETVIEDAPYETSTSSDDHYVIRHETLWGISAHVRPDSRLTMNQTMLAIFEANPEAFGGNINILRAGATLRIPSADEIFQINRSDALEEAKRHHAAWSGATVTVAPVTVAPVVVDTRPSLTLVPPDDDIIDDTYGTDDLFDDQPQSREEEIEQRISDIESADVPDQRSLIEIRDNELAMLRQELARIRGEVYEPLVEDIVADVVDDELLDDQADVSNPFLDDEIPSDDAEITAVDEAIDDEVAEATPAPADIIRTQTRSEPGIVDQIMAALMSKWAAIIAAALALVGGALFWFMRRGGDDAADDGAPPRPLDGDDDMPLASSATESLRVPDRLEDSIMVVEQESAAQPEMDVTVDAPIPEFVPAAEPAEIEAAEPAEDTGTYDSLEDTFSSETAINLDQSDPMAEADFHMAYGLYDQAADLINGALSVEPDRADLLTKLCEIYFVWGNRESFVDAAGRLKVTAAGDDSADWDKIVIMGQQIASDDELFAGASAAGATKEVDLEFEAGAEEGGELDMEFTADSGESADIFDLGESDDTVASDADGDDDIFGGGSDITVDAAMDDDTSISAVLQSPDFDLTAAMPEIDVTAEMPAHDATEEIDVDDLGLNIDSAAETELASLDDLDVTSENIALTDTGINEELLDLAEATGKNPELDAAATGLQSILSEADPAMLDATGSTQVLSEDFAVDTKTDFGQSLADADATMLAPDHGDSTADGPIEDEDTLLASLDDDEPDGDFDFAKTEALPKDAFIGDMAVDETAEVPAVASTDVNLDLDDLTAALKVSEMDDTIEQLREDATVEQPRPVIQDPDATSETMSLSSDEMSDDLHDARTMTEVGTKLDLARAYVDMGDPAGSRSILEEVLEEGDEEQRQQAQQLLDSLPD